MHDIKNNGRIIPNGNKKIERSFTYIDDTVVAITKKYSKFNQIYNTVNNKSVKMNEIIKIIKSTYPKKFGIKTKFQ